MTVNNIKDLPQEALLDLLLLSTEQLRLLIKNRARHDIIQMKRKEIMLLQIAIMTKRDQNTNELPGLRQMKFDDL
jgi:hypothetical protein